MLIAHGANLAPTIPFKRPTGEHFTLLGAMHAANRTSEQAFKTEAIRRMLLRARAVWAVSWTWPGLPQEAAVRAVPCMSPGDTTTTTTPLRRMLQARRHVTNRPNVLLAARSGKIER